MTAIAAERYTGASIKRSRGPAHPDRSGPLRRRHQAAGDAARRVRALADGARPRALGRCLGGTGAARSRRGVHRSGPGSDDGPGAGCADGSHGLGGAHPGVHPARDRQGAFRGRSRGGHHRREPLPRRGWLRARGRWSTKTFLRSRTRPSRSTQAARRCSPIWVTISPARAHATTSATSRPRSLMLTGLAEFHIDVHRHQNVPMEGRGCVASYDPDLGVMTVHAATQSVHVTKVAVAMRLGLEHDKVRVLAGDIGGSFGLKIGASREELAVAAASRTVGQPVKWVEDRGENLTTSGQAREESFDVRAAVSNDGDLLGLDVKMVIDAGAYPGMGAMVPDDRRGDVPGAVQARGPGFRVAPQPLPTRRPMSPTAVPGRRRRSYGNASSISSRRTSASTRSRSGCVTSSRAPIRRLVMVTGRAAGRRHDQGVAGADRPGSVDFPAFRRAAGRSASSGPLPRHRRGHVHRGRSRPARAG